MGPFRQIKTEALGSILMKAVVLAYYSALTVISLLIVLVCMLNAENDIRISVTAGWAGVILFSISGLVVIILGAEFLNFLKIKEK